jgi:hypothetical protein
LLLLLPHCCCCSTAAAAPLLLALVRFDDRTWYPLGRVIGGTVYPVSFFRQLHLCRYHSRYHSSGRHGVCFMCRPSMLLAGLEKASAVVYSVQNGNCACSTVVQLAAPTDIQSDARHGAEPCVQPAVVPPACPGFNQRANNLV